MLKVLIVDNAQNSIDLISSYLKNIEGTLLVGFFSDFNSIEADLDNIDLIIFDINSKNSSEILKKMEALKKAHKNLNFIATSYDINSELALEVLKKDVVEFLIKPTIESIFEAAIKKAQNAIDGKDEISADTICVFSNKGGSGKTSLSVNVASELAKKTSAKTCLLDLSFNFGDIATFLDVEAKYDMLTLIKRLENADSKMALTLAQKYKDDELYVISFKDELALDNKVTPETIIRLISSLKNIFSYIVIDCPISVDELTLSIFSCADIILLLGMLNMASIRNLQKSYELFDNMGFKGDKVKLIINRFIQNSEISIKDVEKTVGADVFYKIPNNYLTLIDAINLGKPVNETNPNSNIAKAYSGLADEILNMDFNNLVGFNPKVNNNHGIFNLLRKMGE